LSEDRLALAVTGEIGGARFVFDVVAEVHDEVGVDLVPHPSDEAFGELGRAMAHFSELSVPADFGTEVEIRYDAEGEAHESGA
jgi:hypothetical protein